MGGGASIVAKRQEETGVFEIKNRMQELRKDQKKVEKVAQHIINCVAEMRVRADKLRIIRFVADSLKQEDCIMSSGVDFYLNGVSLNFFVDVQESLELSGLSFKLQAEKQESQCNFVFLVD